MAIRCYRTSEAKSLFSFQLINLQETTKLTTYLQFLVTGSAIS